MRSYLRPLLVLVVLISAVAAAQSEPEPTHPLLELLAAVPAPATELELEALRFLDYLDLRASERAVGAVTPSNSEAFAALDEAGRDRWLAGTQRWSLLTTTFTHAFGYPGAQMRAQVGFDPFAVDQLIAFGQPPEGSLLLRGHFDPAAVVASHQARGYAAAGPAALASTLLRRADGGDDLALDLANADPANPFGGQLGRKEPLAVLGEGLLANSPSWERLVALAETSESARASLLERAEVRAAAEALTRSPAAPELLIQAQFVSPLEFAGGLGRLQATLAQRLEPAEVERVAGELLAGPLEPYLLAVLVDGYDAGEQLALLALVYPAAEQAAAAAPVLEARLASFSSAPVDGEGTPFLERVGGRPVAAEIVTVGGWAVLVAGVRYPLAAAEVEGEPPIAGALYRQWIGMLLSRAFLPAFL